jgi:hypothetical protein
MQGFNDIARRAGKKLAAAPPSDPLRQNLPTARGFVRVATVRNQI